MRIRAGLVAAVIALVGACSSAPSAPEPSAPTAAQRLTTAKAKVDAAPSMHLVLASKDLPAGLTGVVSAQGWGAHPPAFSGSFQVEVKGTPAGTEVIAVGGKIYAKLPFVGTFAQVDPKLLGAPDPARLFDPATGLTSLLVATTDPAVGPQTRRGSEVLTTVTGRLDGSRIAELFGVGDASGRYAVTYGLTDPAGELRTVELTGPFYAGATSTYSLTLDRYGEPVDIRAP